MCRGISSEGGLSLPARTALGSRGAPAFLDYVVCVTSQKMKNLHQHGTVTIIPSTATKLIVANTIDLLQYYYNLANFKFLHSQFFRPNINMSRHGSWSRTRGLQFKSIYTPYFTKLINVCQRTSINFICHAHIYVIYPEIRGISEPLHDLSRRTLFRGKGSSP